MQRVENRKLDVYQSYARLVGGSDQELILSTGQSVAVPAAAIRSKYFDLTAWSVEQNAFNIPALSSVSNIFAANIAVSIRAGAGAFPATYRYSMGIITDENMDFFPLISGSESVNQITGAGASFVTSQLMAGSHLIYFFENTGAAPTPTIYFNFLLDGVVRRQVKQA